MNEYTMSYIDNPRSFGDWWKLKYSSGVIVLQNNNFSASETWFKYLVFHICPVQQYGDNQWHCKVILLESRKKNLLWNITVW